MKKFLTITNRKEETCRSTSPQPSSSSRKMASDVEPSNPDGSSTSSESETEQRPKRTKIYAQKYREEWEKMDEFKKWIQRSDVGNNYFKCKLCVKDYIGGIAAAKKHSDSKKHKKKMCGIVKQSIITEKSFQFSSDKVLKQNEIRIASFIAEHNIPINVADHLTELVKTIASSELEKSQVSKLSCGRTKCTAIISNVLGRTSFECLIEKLRNKKFSLLADESTDNSCIKHLALVVRYNENFTVKDDFLTLLPIADATAQNLYSVIVNFFLENNIPYKQNLVGFGADGAHSMMGKNNSLKTLLTKDVPHLFVMKCICHSLALCASYASHSLPNDTEKLIRSVYTYMQHSFKRKMEYKHFQIFVNIKPHKLLHPSQTRWLSLNTAVVRVLEQYDALKLYFTSETSDGASGAAEIFELLNNPVNKLYLQFLEFVLPMFTDLNIEFQSERPQIHLLYPKMEAAYKLLLSFYLREDYLKNTNLNMLQYRNPEHYVPLENIYLGAKIAAAVSSKVISEPVIRSLKLNCLKFYTEAAHQIYKRFPFNSQEVEILKIINFLNPPNITSIQSLGPLAVKFLNIVTDINSLDREYRLLKNYEQDLNLEALEFWKKICNTLKGDGSLAYPEISKFVTFLFTLPHSSACVERMFSVINLNKTKIRNRLGTSTLNGILHSKRIISTGRGNCYNFPITNELLNKHNNTMYVE